MRRLAARILTALVVLALAPAPSARAWDPSSTHLGMVDRAALDGELHVRWMDDSGLQRGLFTPLRVDPRRLSPAQRRLVTLALRTAHPDSGAAGLGGPGACPGADAPPLTQARCVEGDLWELTALGWLRLGVIAELVPRARLARHFVDAEDPTSPTWSDKDLPASLVRTRDARSNGAPMAGTWTRTSFGGTGPSTVAWLEDPDDLLAPASLFHHLEHASTEPDPAARDHHRALAMLCAGALLHVVQDLSTPAHARGDLAAFFAPLSTKRGDRGLPLQEFARTQFGRSGLPNALELATRPPQARPAPLASTIRGHLFGDERWEGLVHYAGRRFLSESSLPPPRSLDPDASPERAAKVLLRGVRLAEETTKGATLSPWPAERGYVKTSSGRALAAFERDRSGRTRLFLDRTVYRSQALHLIPTAISVSRSLLEHLWPAWAGLDVRRDADIIELRLNEDLQHAELLVFVESDDGRRALRQRVGLRPGQANRIVGALPADTPERSRTVLVLLARRDGGERVVLEHTVVDEQPAGGETAPAPRARVAPAKKIDAAPAREVTPAEGGSPPRPDDPGSPPPPQTTPDRPAPEAPADPDSQAPPPTPG